MGLNVHIYEIKLVNRGLYVVDDTFNFSFPSKLKSLRTETERLIDELCVVKVSSKYILNT